MIVSKGKPGRCTTPLTALHGMSPGSTMKVTYSKATVKMPHMPVMNWYHHGRPLTLDRKQLCHHTCLWQEVHYTGRVEHLPFGKPTHSEDDDVNSQACRLIGQSSDKDASYSTRQYSSKGWTAEEGRCLLTNGILLIGSPLLSSVTILIKRNDMWGCFLVVCISHCSQ